MKKPSASRNEVIAGYNDKGDPLVCEIYFAVSKKPNKPARHRLVWFTIGLNNVVMKPTYQQAGIELYVDFIFVFITIVFISLILP